MRPVDIRRLVIGRTLQRDTEGWALYDRASKISYRLVGQLWNICTPHLDGAILLGALGALRIMLRLPFRGRSNSTAGNRRGRCPRSGGAGGPKGP